MQIVSLAPVPVASRLWRREGHPWTLAVICKITVRLEAGTARLARSHDPIHDDEITAGAVAASRVHAPSDLVPVRAGVDISLVGDAYALGARGPFSARLRIAGIDKTVRVEPNGPVARAPETFAPLAASSAARRSLLQGNDEPSRDDLPLVLTEGFDLSYFNSAPRDQRVDELPSGALLRLEHLHPDKRLFLTRLPDVVPQIFVQRGRERHEQTAQLDALWIDSRRGRATMTWRCQVPLTAQDESGRVWVTVAGPARRMSPAQLSELIRELGGRDEADAGPEREPAEDPLGRTTAMRRQRKSIEDSPTEPGEMGDALPSLAHTGRFTSALGLLNPAQVLGAAPPWLAQAKRETQPIDLPTPEQFNPAPKPPRDERLDDTASLPAGQHALAQQAMLSASHNLISPPGAGVAEPSRAEPSRAALPPPSASVPGPRPSAVMRAQLANASIARVERAKPALAKVTNDAPSEAPAQAAALRKRPVRPIDLLWFDPDTTLAVRNRWQSLCTELDFAPRDRFHDLPTDDPQLARDHHTHFGLLARAQVTDRTGLRHLIQQSVAEDGRFTAPLCVLEGVLRVRFDNTASLRALVAAMKPFSDNDSKATSKLDNALEHAAAVLEQPSATASTINGARRGIREAFGRSSSTASIDLVDQEIERTLLEQRHYSRRTLLGGEHIRATLKSGKHVLVCYLNEALATRLPMMLSFDARIIAEAHPRQDQYETDNYALRVLTLGRILEL